MKRIPGLRFVTRRLERGYVLLTMSLFLMLLALAAMTAAPDIAFQIRREREEELIHRGVEYSLAIRRFSKKTGKFPTRLEDLQDTYGLRFIRKLYKDPMTGKDFRLLHASDIRPNEGVVNLNPPKPGETGQSGNQPDLNQQQSLRGKNWVTADRDHSGQVIYGVASTSHERSIREFNHKDHYDEWLFFYDPALDRGYVIKGPSTPFVPGAAAGGAGTAGNSNEEPRQQDHP
jgi:type II secretory pathway pseudopilin PulG